MYTKEGATLPSFVYFLINRKTSGISLGLYTLLLVYAVSLELVSIHTYGTHPQATKPPQSSPERHER